MADIYGGRAKAINIPAPVGKKIKGKILEVTLSEKFEGYIDMKIAFQEYKMRSDDGKRDFVKQAFYGIPVDWSTKNKAGRLYYALTGRLPEDNEQVNWTKLLLNAEVACIFEDVLDEATGEPKGQKIKWIGKVGDTETAQEIHVDKSELSPDFEVPF